MNEQGREAKKALKQHILISDGSGHGERASYPDGIETIDLDEHIEPVDAETN